MIRETEKRAVRAVLALLLPVMILTQAGCTKPGDDAPDTVNVRVDGAAEDGKFNQGLVEYKKDTVVHVSDAYDTALAGQIVDRKAVGAEMLFEADFADGDVTVGDDAQARDVNAVGIADGWLYVPYSETEESHFGGSWTTWAPKVPWPIDEYSQAQLSFDGRFYSQGRGQWMAAMVGVFKSNIGAIADNPGDGIFIAFNQNSSSITIYGGDSTNWAWPAGNVTVNVDGDLIKGDTHVDIVANENKDIYVYLKGTLVLRVACADGKMSVFDGAGSEKYTGNIDMDALEGEYFSFFSHLGGVAMDNISITGCSRGKKKTTTTISAVPVGEGRLGLDITDRTDVVSICYTMWFNAIHGEGKGKIEKALNVEELIEQYGFSAEYGFGTKNDQHNHVPAFHYWSKPAQGYYRSTDTDAIRNNMKLLYNAGVDFIILDYTYATSPGYNPGTGPWSSYIEGPVIALLDTIMEMRAEGQGTPYVVFWMGSSNMFDIMYERFMQPEKWQDCFVYWNGRPFIMNWSKDDTDYEALFPALTVRSMYGLRGEASVNQWSYLEIDNSRTVSYGADGKPEHMCADVATQETYMSQPTAHGRQGGRFWNGQWKNVFSVHPKIVTVTWWNEWCAQEYYVDGVGYIFTDNFNQEYSRDVEPMEGGHGDQYYRWLCEYIRCYKNGKNCPNLVE
ncbi:MAG: hypothetical protein IJM24_01960 [Clostridia bacterium]|nr:hypothetical protein [Clostridia bacterium]